MGCLRPVGGRPQGAQAVNLTRAERAWFWWGVIVAVGFGICLGWWTAPFLLYQP